MKRFIIFLLIFILLPAYAFSASSPTVGRTVSCEPKLTYYFADQTVGWDKALRRLEWAKSLTNDFIMIEALSVFIDRPYKRVEWALTIPIMTEHEPFVLILDRGKLIQQETSITEDGKIVTDFSEIIPGTYYICFYIKVLE